MNYGWGNLNDADKKLLRSLNNGKKEEKVEKNPAQLNKEIEDISRTWISTRLNELEEKGVLNVREESNSRYFSITDKYTEFVNTLTKQEIDSELIQRKDFDRISSENYIDRGSDLRKTSLARMFYATSYGYPESAKSLSDLEVSDNELDDVNTVIDILTLAMKKVESSAEPKLYKIAQDVYEAKAASIFESENLEKVQAARDNILEVLWNDFRYSYSSVIIQPDEYDGVPGFNGIDFDSLEDYYERTERFDIKWTDDEEVSEQLFKQFLRELEKEIRSLKRLNIVVTNYASL